MNNYCMTAYVSLSWSILHFLFVVPVRFNPTMYTRTEGIDKFANVTLEATKDHDFPFKVELCTRDGSAERM